MKTLADIFYAATWAQLLRLVGIGAIGLAGCALTWAFNWPILWTIEALAIFMALFGLRLPRHVGWGRAILGLAMAGAFGYMAWCGLF